MNDGYGTPDGDGPWRPPGTTGGGPPPPPPGAWPPAPSQPPWIGQPQTPQPFGPGGSGPGPFGGPAGPGGPSASGRRRRSWLVLVGIVAAVAVGGALVLNRSDDGEPGGGERAEGRVRSTTTTTERTSATAGARPDRTVTNRDDDEVVTDAITDIEDFWEATYQPLYGSPYQPISGGFHPYGPDTDLPPCPGIDSYELIAGNAFYCPEADLIAWDSEELIPTLREEFGVVILGIVMAHEIGHAVQFRTNFEGRTVTLEQQADCFAGAWVRSVADGRSEAFVVGPNELDQALAGMLNFRDPAGVTGADPGAHGSAFDRVGALQDGFENGAGACTLYTEESVDERLVAEAFTDPGDLARGGDLPLDQIPDLAIADLEDYWAQVFESGGQSWTPVSKIVPFDPDDDPPACGQERSDRDDYVGVAFYCETDDYVAWDETYLLPELYEQGGDFSVAAVIGEQYAVAVQSRLGVEGQPLDLALQSDCLTGAWAADSFNRVRSGAPMVMSPGDLDEAILAMLALGDPPDILEAGRAERGSGFQRVSAFRDGFFGAGLGVCDAYLG